MDIGCNVKGSYKPFINKLKKMSKDIGNIDLDYFGKLGVQKLKKETPKDSSETANSWSYSIENTDKGKILSFNNSNVTPEGTPIAILLEYGHATRSGTWFDGYNFINPTINKVIGEIISKINEAIK